MFRVLLAPTFTRRKGEVDMEIHAYDVIRLKDGREVTVLDVLEDGTGFRVETSARAYEESDILEIHADEVSKVVWRSTK